MFIGFVRAHHHRAAIWTTIFADQLALVKADALWVMSLRHSWFQPSSLASRKHVAKRP